MRLLAYTLLIKLSGCFLTSENLILAADDSKNPEYKYELSICIIFQNEAPYLKEWIEYHKLLGVEHFYCFNHYSNDNYQEVLKTYLQDGTAELKDVLTIANDLKTYYPMQYNCYTDCVQKAKGESKWIAFIDPDEFILPVQDIRLTDFLKGYEEFGGVSANWMMFGTSYLKKIPADRLLIESLTMCAEKSLGYNRYVKSIVRPERVSHFESAHNPVYVKGYSGVNTDKMPIIGDKTHSVLWNKLRINHYWTRDEDFFYKIKVPRQKKWGGSPDPQIIFKSMNVNKEETILRYVPPLRTKMIK